MFSRTEKGFVLLEALVALAIVGTFAIAVIATVGSQVRAADRGSSLLIAQTLAEDVQVAIELLDRDDLASLPDSVAAGVFPAPFEQYRWTAQVEAIDKEADLFGTLVEVTDGNYLFPLRGMLHRSETLVAAAPTQ
jgi:type II secretory pathway pseudopilin PulG